MYREVLFLQSLVSSRWHPCYLIFALLVCCGGERGLCLGEVLIPPTLVQQLGIMFAVKHVKIASALLIQPNAECWALGWNSVT